MPLHLQAFVLGRHIISCTVSPALIPFAAVWPSRNCYWMSSSSEPLLEGGLLEQSTWPSEKQLSCLRWQRQPQQLHRMFKNAARPRWGSQMPPMALDVGKHVFPSRSSGSPRLAGVLESHGKLWKYLHGSNSALHWATTKLLVSTVT